MGKKERCTEKETGFGENSDRLFVYYFYDDAAAERLSPKLYDSAAKPTNCF